MNDSRVGLKPHTPCCFIYFSMQTLPQSLLDSAELAQITLEHKKECGREGGGRGWGGEGGSWACE